jgi:hypothetical protein
LFPTKEENLKFYFFRTVYLSIQKQLNLNWDNQDNSHELSLEKANETAPLVLEKMFVNGTENSSAKVGDKVTFEVPFRVRLSDKLFKIIS